MKLLSIALALAPAPDTAASGTYRAVTETEYAIELALKPNGQAELALNMWVAGDEPHPTDTSVLHGSWSRDASRIVIRFSSGKSVTYTFVSCLPYRDFGAPGCSPGLKLVETTLPMDYDLHRYGLWRADDLRVQP